MILLIFIVVECINEIKKNGLLEGYMAWDWETSLLDASPLNFPTGCGGVLYPPHCFNDEVFNENVF